MKVTVFEGSTEDIISKVKESDSNLFKVAVVEDIGKCSEYFMKLNPTLSKKTVFAQNWP